MDDKDKPKGWWYTLPGVITSLAAVVTALAGLIAAFTQTGWFAPQPPPGIATSSPPTAVAPTEAPPRSASVTSPTSPERLTYPVSLPSVRDYKLGEATFTLLKAEVSAQTIEKDALQIRLRMMNHSRYDANFWDDSFRLIVADGPMAPESGLNELVPGQSAKEGDVIFAVPHGTAAGKLKIIYAGESTEIPLALEASH